MTVPESMQNSLVSPEQISCRELLRELIRGQILNILKSIQKQSEKIDDVTQLKYFKLASAVDDRLFKMAKSEEEYSNTRDLEARVRSLLSRFSHLHSHQSFAAAAASTSCVRINGPIDNDDLHRLTTTAAANDPMMERLRASQRCMCKRWLQSANQSQALPRSSMRNSDSCGSSNLYGSSPSNPNPMLRVETTFNHLHMQGMQQTPLLKPQYPHRLGLDNYPFASTNNTENFAQVSQQPLDHGVSQDQGQCFQQLDTSANHELNMGSNKEALQKHAINGLKPSKFQYQQNSVKDHYIVSRSTSVYRCQLNSSPSLPPLSHQNSASFLVQTQSSLHNSTQISENSNGDKREHNGVNSCQRIPPMKPGVINHSPISNESNTSSKVVTRDCGLENMIRWLILLFHANDCKETEDKCGGTKSCSAVKELREHTDRCKIPECTYPRCRRTRKLLSHYFQCKEKSCTVCVNVKNFKLKKSAESRKAYNKGVEASPVDDEMQRSAKRLETEKRSHIVIAETEPPSVDDDMQPSSKRLKAEKPYQNVVAETERNSVAECGSVVPMDTNEEDCLQSDECKSVGAEVMPMNIEVSDAYGAPITRELKKHVAEISTTPLPTQGKYNQMSEANEENVKQYVDTSKIEISSLVDLFTPEQVRKHISSLRVCVGQSKTKAKKNKAMGQSMSSSSCKLCAVEKLVFEPIPMNCSPCGARIKRHAFYYSLATRESQRHVCLSCYNEARENSVSVNGTSVPKESLMKKRNDEKAIEGWVQCDKCEGWQHQICALFNSRENHGEATKYTCPNCYIQEVEQGERKPLPESAILGATSLPVTTLSNHIEQRLFKMLKKERQERAQAQGKCYEEVPGAEPLAVRVVSSVDKVSEVKECFIELLREENYPLEFPYKSKFILLFQKIESVEVCIFGMFVQEYGTESGPPNQRRVNLSYIDSVKYFRPEIQTVSGEALRTFVYHEILIGYLDYCKKRGFISCYIWACPPLKGDDYILNCHPKIQKRPKNDKLREWYLAMLSKASKEGVVVECTNLYDHFFVQSGECRANVTVARLPYFDGDYFPDAVEDLIHRMSQEDDGTQLNTKGLTKRKRSLRDVGRLELPINASKDQLMMHKLGEIICPMKEDFILVHLQHCCKHCCTLMVTGNRWVCKQCKDFQICDKCNEAEQKRTEKERHPINQKEKHILLPVAIEDVPIEVEEKDENMDNEFFDNRQAFLNLCQGNNYQYDTLRRAKHSSMMILYHLHNPTAPAFPTTCTICQQEVENTQGWLCKVCPGYDVCNACYSKASTDHPHDLISRSSTIVRANQLEKIRQVMVHTIECRFKQCTYKGCRIMKMLFRHCERCKTNPGACSHCLKFWIFVKQHARSCRDAKCTVPKCRDLKISIRKTQQQVEKRRRADVIEMMRERAAEATNNTS